MSILLVAMLIGIIIVGVRYRNKKVKDNKEVVKEVLEIKEIEEKTEEEKLYLERKNAVKSAELCLKILPYSRQGLIEMLEYGGYSNDASVYAVDNVTVDWNEQCAKAAEMYLKSHPFDRRNLHIVLEYKGFTKEQIRYWFKSLI